ncbi:hypothetical protein [Kordia sp.]|uniref:hypothetical protein n=1 Tax=Kordia sp. TaxID=1965332 RepID=UPI003B5B4033
MITLKNINTFFYVALLTSFLIFLLPVEYKMAVYSLNYLGWLMIALILLSCVVFFGLLIVDISKKNFKRLLNRTLFFTLIIAVSVAYWFYMAYSLGNL